MATVRSRAAQVARSALALPGVLIAVVVAGLLGSPAIAQAAVGATGTHAASAQHAATAQHAASAQHGDTAQSATLTAASTARDKTAPSGICSAPGIGDIGGLLGFCNAGSSGLIGDLNNICQPSVPAPEPAAGGIDSLIRPPVTGGKQPATLYDTYGMAGQSWAAYDMQCSDMTSLIGNSVAGMVFDASKALDRVTITVYQSAAGEGILSWLTNSVDRLITSLGNAIYFPFLAPVVILGAIWLAWQGLIRKRATRTIEGTIWMVIACAAAIWLIGRPADFTGLGKTVSNGITQTLNVAFSGLPAPAASNCVPVQGHDPQVKTASYNFTGGTGIVDQNANELWTVLVCKPWLDGEFGTTTYTTAKGAKPTVVNQYGRQLLWAQAIATNENPTASLIQAKQDAYAGIAQSIKQNDPDVYSLFQGNQYSTRLEIAFASLFAALVAGVLILLIAITLIILKLGFLLLLVAGPFFLIVGTHPGFGRVVALRWVEMLVGVLLKEAAVALVLSILLYSYSLIMGTSDAVLPWALKILMIALVTVAVFIYRKPFVHLFSAVGYGMVGSRDRAEAGLAQAGSLARRNTVDAAAVGVPGFAAYRAARWARRNPAQAAGLAAAAAGGAGAAAAGARRPPRPRWAARTAGPTRPVRRATPPPTRPRADLAAAGWPRAAGAGPPPRPRPTEARARHHHWTCRTGTALASSGRHRAGPAPEQPTPPPAGLRLTQGRRRFARCPGVRRRCFRIPAPGTRAPSGGSPAAAPPSHVRPGSPGSGPAALAGGRPAPARVGPPAVRGRGGPARARHRPRSEPPQRAVVPHPAAVRPLGAAPPPARPPGAATRGAARRAVTAMVGPVSGAVRRAQPAGARLVGRPGMRRPRCGPGTAARVAAPGVARPAGQAARATPLRHPPRLVSSEAAAEAARPEAARPARARRPGRPVPSGCARCAGRSSGASWT